MKLRMFEIMQETDKIDVFSVQKWLMGINCKCLCVLHDKDETRNHYHIFVKMDNARDIDDISKHCNVSPNFIQKINRWENALAYAFHLMDTDKTDGKYKYDKSACVFSSKVDIDDIFTNDIQVKEQIIHDKEIADLMCQYGDMKITKKQLFAKLSARDFDKHSALFNNMVKYRAMQIKDRCMQVIYITGASGSGKTTFAKYLADKNNYDYFISGSGADVLDGYDKEECIILDDLRADSFTKSELFKLCDNHTDSSVKSRYCNKNISNCKLLIITSIKTPKDLYNWNDINDNEPFKQFSRRLNDKYLCIDTNQVVLEHNMLDDTCDILLDFKPIINTIIAEKSSIAIVNDVLSIFRVGLERQSLKAIDSDDLPF